MSLTLNGVERQRQTERDYSVDERIRRKNSVERCRMAAFHGGQQIGLVHLSWDINGLADILCHMISRICLFYIRNCTGVAVLFRI